jgi:hypothetical protein
LLRFSASVLGITNPGVRISGEIRQNNQTSERTVMEKTLALAAAVLGIVVSVALFAGQVMA